jgi:hypothetical protein
MIKVENDMLVLDSTFTKEDVKAIDEFVKINVDKERERIIKLLEDAGDCKCSPEYGVDYDNTCYCDALLLIKGENK